MNTAPAKLLESLAAGVLAVDPGFRIEYINPAAESLLGVGRRRAQGADLRELLTHSHELVALAERAGQTRSSCSESALRHAKLRAPDIEIALDVTVSVYDRRPDGDALLVELQDAGPRLRLDREKASQWRQDVSRTIARQLAHEIKNPLGGMRGAAQLLERRLETDAQREYTAVIIREADRLATMVNRLLGPGGPLSRRDENIHRLLHHVRRLVAAEAPAGVELHEDYDPSLPKLNLDSDRIIQALLNLARNALQSVGDAGRIVLRTRAESRAVIGDTQHGLVARIDVEDDGPGVPPELRERIFFPLVTGRPDGSGIGLAVAQELVTQHGGTIELRAGKTTVFSMYLPVAEP